MQLLWRFAIDSSPMAKDPFRESWNARRKWEVAFATFVVALFVLFLAAKYYSGLSPANKIFGVVQSSGPTNVSRIYGGTRDTALVRLTDGRVVPAYVNEGGPLPPGVGAMLFSGPLSAGETVTLLEQPGMWGSPRYEVIAKNSDRGLRTQSDAPLQ